MLKFTLNTQEILIHRIFIKIDHRDKHPKQFGYCFH